MRCFFLEDTSSRSFSCCNHCRRKCFFPEQRKIAHWVLWQDKIRKQREICTSFQKNSFTRWSQIVRNLCGHGRLTHSSARTCTDFTADCLLLVLQNMTSKFMTGFLKCWKLSLKVQNHETAEQTAPTLPWKVESLGSKIEAAQNHGCRNYCFDGNGEEKVEGHLAQIAWYQSHCFLPIRIWHLVTTRKRNLHWINGTLR